MDIKNSNEPRDEHSSKSSYELSSELRKEHFSEPNNEHSDVHGSKSSDELSSELKKEHFSEPNNEHSDVHGSKSSDELSSELRKKHFSEPNNEHSDVHSSEKSRKKYTKDEVINIFKKTGILTSRQINRHPDLPAYTTILRLFETTKINDVWNTLNFSLPSKYTKEGVSKALEKTGKLTSKQISQHPDLPALNTILKLFGTKKINEVWKELSIS